MSTFIGYTPCQIIRAYGLNQIKFPIGQLPGTSVNIIGAGACFKAHIFQ